MAGMVLRATLLKPGVYGPLQGVSRLYLQNSRPTAAIHDHEGLLAYVSLVKELHLGTSGAM